MGLSTEVKRSKTKVEGAESLTSKKGLSEARTFSRAVSTRHGEIKVSKPVTGVLRPETEEVRAYILAMAAELADMADKIHDKDLADHLRTIAWPTRPQSLFSERG